MNNVRILKQYVFSNSTFVLQSKMFDEKLHSLVLDKDERLLVPIKPNVIIGRSLKRINSSFPHARDISKEVLGDTSKKLPLVIGNHFGQPLVIFPLFSPDSKDNCWVFYNAITKIGGVRDSVQVEFKHQYEWTANVSRQVFNNQYVNATNLYKAISQRWSS